MRKLMWALCAMLSVTASSQAAIIVQSLGTAAPPGTLGGYVMTPFPNDPRPNFTNVSSISSPLPGGGSLGFSIPLNLREIGSGWATWSHGYTGDVYYTNGATSVTMTMPTDTGAFYFYAEPNPFATFTMTATANDGTFLSQNVSGSAGAAGWGFFTTGGSNLTSITISSNVDFAVGEFGVSPAATPEPISMIVFGGLLLGGAGVALRRRMTAKAIA